MLHYYHININKFHWYETAVVSQIVARRRCTGKKNFITNSAIVIIIKNNASISGGVLLERCGAHYSVRMIDWSLPVMDEDR